MVCVCNQRIHQKPFSLHRNPRFLYVRYFTPTTPWSHSCTTYRCSHVITQPTVRHSSIMMTPSSIRSRNLAIRVWYQEGPASCLLLTSKFVCGLLIRGALARRLIRLLPPLSRHSGGNFIYIKLAFVLAWSSHVSVSVWMFSWLLGLCLTISFLSQNFVQSKLFHGYKRDLLRISISIHPTPFNELLGLFSSSSSSSCLVKKTSLSPPTSSAPSARPFGACNWCRRYGITGDIKRRKVCHIWWCFYGQ